MTGSIGITSAHLLQAASVARSKAAELDVTVAVAISDDGGHLLYLERTSETIPFSVNVAIGKARTSALTRRSTAFWEERVASNPHMATLPDLLPIKGGVPVIIGGSCLGAVGVSGARSDQDELIAQAAADALSKAIAY